MDATQFIFTHIVGNGSFAIVYSAMHVTTRQKVAIKVLEKVHVLKAKVVKQVNRERDVLCKLSKMEGCNFFIKMLGSFQDEKNLFFVMPYEKYGDLRGYIKSDSFDIECARFYSAEIVCALEYLHDANVIHRDLKPENILLDEKFHIKIIDFGCAKIYDESGSSDHERRNSFVGTAEYVSPEMMSSCSSPSSDLWAVGCIIFQMITRYSLFRKLGELRAISAVEEELEKFPPGLNKNAEDLIRKLLVINPTERIGAKDKKRYTSIRQHPFYENLNFDSLQTTSPPSDFCSYMSGIKIKDNFQHADRFAPGYGVHVYNNLYLLDNSDDDDNDDQLIAKVDNCVLTDRKNNSAMIAAGSDSTSKVDKSNSAAIAGGSDSALVTDVVDSPVLENENDSALLVKPSPVVSKRVGSSNLQMINTRNLLEQPKPQQCENEWFDLVEGNAIVKQGLVYVRSGIFSRNFLSPRNLMSNIRRMFTKKYMLILTKGPFLYFVDPDKMTLERKLPLCHRLRIQTKSFILFCVHTPDLTYCIKDPDGFALEWYKAIEEMRLSADVYTES